MVVAIAASPIRDSPVRYAVTLDGLTHCQSRSGNRSEHTIASCLESLRQAEAFLAGRGRSLLDARREDLEAFLGELLQRRAPRPSPPATGDCGSCTGGWRRKRRFQPAPWRG
jgi:hypothetical protein